VADLGAELEGQARTAYLHRDFRAAIDAWEQAYAAHRAAGTHAGAVRCARTLGYMYGAVVRDPAVMSGWVARAQTLLGDEQESLEAGWVALTVGMFAADRHVREDRFREALALARRFGDSDLELGTLAYLGASLVHDDRTDEGMALLDEALAGVAGSEVDDTIVLGDIFCQLFAACEHAHDVARADQWIRVGRAVAERLEIPSVSAFCNTHYGGLLTAAGRWAEADAALTEAIRLWDLGYRPLRPDAQARLAQLRVRQGRWEEAEHLLGGLEVDPDTAPPLAAARLARGDVAAARDVLEHALEQVEPTGTAAAPVLAQLVDVELAAGRVDAAGAAADRLAACAAEHPRPYLAGLAALARGRVCLARGDGDARSCLRTALAGFGRAQAPLELARARLQLAAAISAEQPEAARTEARAALDVFQSLDARRDVDAAAALLRSLGVRAAPARRGDGVLTRREAEILELLGHGLSNPDISERLYISRKTVEHHVGNILAKLGLRSRAEAAAYATRSKPAAE
jgi:DNA-binding CsgD family transcriptional regulator